MIIIKSQSYYIIINNSKYHIFCNVKNLLGRRLELSMLFGWPPPKMSRSRLFVVWCVVVCVIVVVVVWRVFGDKFGFC